MRWRLLVEHGGSHGWSICRSRPNTSVLRNGDDSPSLGSVRSSINETKTSPYGPGGEGVPGKYILPDRCRLAPHGRSHTFTRPMGFHAIGIRVRLPSGTVRPTWSTGVDVPESIRWYAICSYRQPHLACRLIIQELIGIRLVVLLSRPTSSRPVLFDPGDGWLCGLGRLERSLSVTGRHPPVIYDAPPIAIGATGPNREVIGRPLG